MVCKDQFEMHEGSLLVRAPAKINLSLLVGDKRDDGFHEIDTIMAKINYYDELVFQQSRQNGIELMCTGQYWAPQGQENLVWQGCNLAYKIAEVEQRAKITLRKNIPAGSGLGSASSDAAAALMGINKFAGLGLSQKTLIAATTQLGSDVPFFMGAPIAKCTGRGEKIQKIEQEIDFLALLILPQLSVSTKTVYENYQYNHGIYQKLNKKINSYIEKNRVDLIAQMCANMLEESCFALYGQLVELKAKIESLGIRPICLTGSGSAMFHIMDGGDRKKTEYCQQKLRDEIGCKSVIVTNNRW